MSGTSNSADGAPRASGTPEESQTPDIPEESQTPGTPEESRAPGVVAAVAPPAPVALLGLGAMGSRLAPRLVAAGYRLQVWNRTPAAAERVVAASATITPSNGATTGASEPASEPAAEPAGQVVAAASPAQAAAGAAAVLVCVRDDEASTRVWDEVGPVLATDALAVELSTLTPAHVRRLARRLGPRFLEAPMVGSRPQAEAGQLRLLVGGTEQAVARALPLLRALGAGVHHIGVSGQAAVAKLAVNGLLAVQLAAAGELLGTARASGLDPAALAELLTALPVTAPALARSLPRALAGDTSPNFPLELVAKDLRYLDALPGGPRPVIGGTRLAVDVTAGTGHGDEDIVVLAEPGSRSPQGE